MSKPEDVKVRDAVHVALTEALAEQGITSLNWMLISKEARDDQVRTKGYNSEYTYRDETIDLIVTAVEAYSEPRDE